MSKICESCIWKDDCHMSKFDSEYYVCEDFEPYDFDVSEVERQYGEELEMRTRRGSYIIGDYVS